MIGEADVPDRAGLLLLPDPIQNTDLPELFPHGNIGQMVHQVIIHIVGTQPVQFLVKVAVQRRSVSDQILWKLGRDVDLLTDVIALEYLPHGGLAARVDIRGVIVIDPGLIGGQQFLLGLVDVDAAAFFGKAHAAIAQNAQVVSSSVFSVLHLNASPSLCKAGAVPQQARISLPRPRVTARTCL